MRIQITLTALNNAQQSKRLGRNDDAIQQLITAVRCMLHADLEDEFHEYIANGGGANYQSWLYHEKDIQLSDAKKIAS